MAETAAPGLSARALPATDEDWKALLSAGLISPECYIQVQRSKHWYWRAWWRLRGLVSA